MPIRCRVKNGLLIGQRRKCFDSKGISKALSSSDEKYHYFTTGSNYMISHPLSRAGNLRNVDVLFYEEHQYIAPYIGDIGVTVKNTSGDANDPYNDPYSFNRSNTIDSNMVSIEDLISFLKWIKENFSDFQLIRSMVEDGDSYGFILENSKCGSYFHFIIAENEYESNTFYKNLEYSEKLIDSLINFDYDRQDVEKDFRVSVSYACTKNSQFVELLRSMNGHDEFTMFEKPKDLSIRFIQKSHGQLDLAKHSIGHHDFTDIMSLYSEDFIDVDKRIKATLEDDRSGLYLLHGDMGTGKTSYIRYLMHHLIESHTHKKVIYMPPNMVDAISSPEFIQLLIKNPSSVVIIEDAENILQTREAGGNSAVANILNSTSGLLGDVMRAQFICTFNADRTKIDKALLREGRLIQEYKFNKLPAEQCKKLWVSRFNRPLEEFPNTSMSLAELFNWNERIEVEVQERSKIGFI